jgi:bifunctional non-homologous end joining protein LigD
MVATARDLSSVRIADVELTNPERVLYPEQGISKLQLAEYYQNIADYILPYITNRPLSLVRCPQGLESACFYQRHLDDAAPAGVEKLPLTGADGKVANHIVIRDLTGLISLVQLGTLELHPWGASADDPEHPDWIVFDLDPGIGASWPSVVHAARWLHRRLATLGLKSFVRTTGGKGLHVVVPIVPEHDWDTVKAFSRAIAHELVDDDPLRYIATASKEKRVGKVFIDYLRNARGASSIANYSPRARARAPVATPRGWWTLAELDGSDVHTIADIPGRMNVLSEGPWTGFFELRQSLTDAMLEETVHEDP